MKKILVLSIISPDKEGRLKKTISLLTRNYNVILVCPKCDLKFLNCTHISIGNRRPIGIKEQITFVYNAIRTLDLFRQHLKSIDALYVANVLSVPSSLFLIRKIGISKIIYDAYELFFTMRNKKIRIKNRIYIRLEKAIIKRADLIVEANYERALLSQGYYQLEKLPAVVSNFNYIVKDNNSNNTYKVLSKKRVVLGYIGYISKERKLDNLITEIAKDQSIELHIYGGGNDEIELRRMVEASKIKNIYFHGEYNIDELESILSEIDIGYINYPYHNYNNMYCEPNKIYEYSANRVPMVSYVHPKLERIFNDNGIGIADDSIVHAISIIRNNYSDYVEACHKFYFLQKALNYREEQEFIAAVENII